MTSSASGRTRREPAEGNDPLLGKVLDGRYRIEEVLGTGGVGIVYRAVHLALSRPVAIKVLHGELGALHELRQRFRREAQVLSALSHPHIVAINDYGIADGVPYLVMELLEGRTLADLIDDDGPPAPDVAIDIARQMLRGLAFAHARGIVHRDLKAANIFLVSLPDTPYHVKILDFGLAKIYGTEEEGGDAVRERTLTKSGTILGTPAYMSPEQASGSSVDERTDVYSAGVVLFELLTGRCPFLASTRGDMFRAHMLEPVPSVADALPGLEVVPGLDALIQKAMSKERPARYPHAQAMLDALDALPKPAARWAPATESGRVGRSAVATNGEEPTQPLGYDGAEAPPGRTDTRGLRDRRRLAKLALVSLAVLVASTAAVYLWLDAAHGAGAGGVPPPRVHGVLEETAPAAEVAEEPEGEEPAGEPEAVAEEALEAEGELALDAGPVATEETEGIEEVEEGPSRAGMPPAYDPFEQILPQPLRRYHLKVRSGNQLLRAERRALQRLQQRMRGDPRPTLVLAHHFVDIGFFSDAIERYELAFKMDAAMRGDARMIRDLVRLSGNRAVGDRAADLVARVYGPEALPEVERQLRTTMDPEALDRLTLLRSRLAGE